jgi:protocatechuate 3,4-dioxygenase beta subunit
MIHSPQRRRLLSWIGAASLAPLAPAPLLADDGREPTPPLTEGPFYPRLVPDETDADLTRVRGRPGIAAGQPLQVSGRVVDRQGRPLAGARMEIWQCDARGQYHHVGEPDRLLDANFQGFGAVVTDPDGRYAFRTIKPVPYPGRTPHIHFAVLEGGRRRLTSQMFVEGEPRNERDGLYRRLGADARRVTMKLEDAGEGLRGALDIVLA